VVSSVQPLTLMGNIDYAKWIMVEVMLFSRGEGARVMIKTFHGMVKVLG
jgi:hypothetical protein